MDEDGYPTEETLERIRNWDIIDFKGLVDFIHPLWKYEDYSIWDGITWEVSTGGWSGHETILSELPMIWQAMFKYSWQRGGHYVFKQ